MKNSERNNFKSGTVKDRHIFLNLFKLNVNYDALNLKILRNL